MRVSTQMVVWKAPDRLVKQLRFAMTMVVASMLTLLVFASVRDVSVRTAVDTLRDNTAVFVMSNTMAIEISRMQSTLVANEKEIFGLQKEIGSLHQEVAGLQKEIGSLHQEVAGLQQRLETERNTSKTLAMQLSQALVPEATVGEAFANHVTTPVKQKATAAKDSTVRGFNTAVDTTQRWWHDSSSKIRSWFN